VERLVVTSALYNTLGLLVGAGQCTAATIVWCHLVGDWMGHYNCGVSSAKSAVSSSYVLLHGKWAFQAAAYVHRPRACVSGQQQVEGARLGFACRVVGGFEGMLVACPSSFLESVLAHIALHTPACTPACSTVAQALSCNIYLQRCLPRHSYRITYVTETIVLVRA
jgi:hypothetical protein